MARSDAGWSHEGQHRLTSQALEDILSPAASVPAYGCHTRSKRRIQRAHLSADTGCSQSPIRPLSQGMRPGGKRKLLVPKALAPKGVDLPDGVTLEYEIELLEVLPNYF